MAVAKCKCGAILTYEGDGKFVCPECNTSITSPLGRIREYQERHPNASRSELLSEANVSDEVLNKLLGPKNYKKIRIFES